MGILRAFIESHAHPGGFVGMLAALHMTHDNRDANYWIVSLLDINPTDHVLEVGFGPGLAIQKVAAIVSKGVTAQPGLTNPGWRLPGTLPDLSIRQERLSSYPKGL